MAGTSEAGPSRSRLQAQVTASTEYSPGAAHVVSSPAPSPILKGKRSSAKSKPEPIPYTGSSDPAGDEQTAVHEVYERIAPHFSQTRHKAWPLIVSFLRSLPPNSIGLDSGGGNGKYVPEARAAGLEVVVMDRSMGLLEIARGQGFGYDRISQGTKGDSAEGGHFTGGSAQSVGECVRGDLCGTSWREGTFDFAISIAAIHHLSTAERRQRAVQALLQPLLHSASPPYSRFLIYVWAYEQGSLSKRRMGTATAPDRTGSFTGGLHAGPAGHQSAGASADGSDTDPDHETAKIHRDVQGEQQNTARKDEDIVQDVLVPWVLQPNQARKSKTRAKDEARPPSKSKSPLKGRPCDRSEPPESTDNIDDAGIGGGEPMSTSVSESAAESISPQPGPQVFHRYYHLFVQGELGELVREAARAGGYAMIDDASPGADGVGEGAGGGCRGGESARVMTDQRISGEGVEEGLQGGVRSRNHGPEGRHSGLEPGTRWLRIRNEGWEADNWWLEGEVGVS